MRVSVCFKSRSPQWAAFVSSHADSYAYSCEQQKWKFVCLSDWSLRLSFFYLCFACVSKCVGSSELKCKLVECACLCMHKINVCVCVCCIGEKQKTHFLQRLFHTHLLAVVMTTALCVHQLFLCPQFCIHHAYIQHHNCIVCVCVCVLIQLSL